MFTTANPCVVANQATGKVKKYQLVVGGILLSILPVSYIALRLGAPAYSVFIIHLCAEIVAQFSRIFMLRKLIKLPIWLYMKNIYIPIFATVIISVIIPYILHTQFEEGWHRFILVFIACILSVGISAFFVGFTEKERKFFVEKGLQMLKIRK